MQELRISNDEVIGEHRRFRLLPMATGLMFDGYVSLANGAGFVSFCAPLRLPPDVAARKVADRVDARRYRFVLRTDAPSGAAQYQAPCAAPLRLDDAAFCIGNFRCEFSRSAGGGAAVAPHGRPELMIGEGRSRPVRVILELRRAS